MQRTPRGLAAVAAVALVAALAAGCGSGASSTRPGDAAAQVNADDVAIQVGVLLAAGNGGLLVSTSTGAVPASMSPARAGAARMTGAAAVAAETTFTVGAMTWHVVRAFYDAQGNLMAAYDPVLSTRMLTMSDAHGTITMPRYSATLGHSSSLDLRGIAVLQDTLRFTGVAHDTCLSACTSLDSTRTRHLYVECAGTWMNVRWLKPVSTYPWPLSGTATWVVSADRLRSGDRADVEAHLDATATVTFNGTRNVIVVIDGTWTYTLDLLTGAVART